MTQALILFHCECPFSWQRSEIHADRRKGQTLVSLPAKPGAYLYELVTKVSMIMLLINTLNTNCRLCDNLCIYRHRVFAGIAARGKSSTGWFFGFKLQIAINHRSE